MAQNAYPTGSDVQTSLTAEGLAYPPNCSGYATAASERWEQMTTYMPFLAESVDSESYFTNPERGLDYISFEGGFVAVTSVTVNLTPDDTTGTVLTLHTDYELEPYNALLRNEPYRRLVFRTSLYRGYRSIKVIGKRGYSTTITDDDWVAIRNYAKGLALTEVMQGTGTLKEEWTGPVKLTYDNDQGRSKLDRYLNGLSIRAKQYKREY